MYTGEKNFEDFAEYVRGLEFAGQDAHGLYFREGDGAEWCLYAYDGLVLAMLYRDTLTSDGALHRALLQHFYITCWEARNNDALAKLLGEVCYAV